jgi:hypothetical protein
MAQQSANSHIPANVFGLARDNWLSVALFCQKNDGACFFEQADLS